MLGERVYRALLLLYPRRFRREYHDPMVQLYRDARRDGTTSWARCAGDVVVSAPVQYREALRAMSTSTKLITAAVVTTVAIVVFMAIGGAMFALALLLLLAWILHSLLKERGAQLSPAFWWKLTLSGVGIFVVAFVFFAGPWPDSWRESVPGELAWWSGFFIFAIAIVMIVGGLFSGVLSFASRRRFTR